MPYPEELVRPMREELTRLGVEELRDAAAVDAAFTATKEGTLLLIINSVCGCAAANARPAVAMALQAPVAKPDRWVTVFAGQDVEATAQARKYLAGIPPSSPFIALFKYGEPVYVLERRHIEGRSASAIASDLVQAFQKYCGTDTMPEDGPEMPEVTTYDPSVLPPTFRSIL